MRDFLLTPCRIGWLLVILALITFGIATRQWTILLAVSAPVVGAALAWFAGRRAPACSLEHTIQREDGL